jgi:hypothetical protein
MVTRMPKQQATCYACDQPATTKEHAPPFSFFPNGYKENLITVPSCEAHNNANSKDVEYARNVITILYGANSVGEQHFSDKSVRSFDHSPALLRKTFSDIQPISFRGDTVGSKRLCRPASALFTFAKRESGLLNGILCFPTCLLAKTLVRKKHRRGLNICLRLVRFRVKRNQQRPLMFSSIRWVICREAMFISCVSIRTLWFSR